MKISFALVASLVAGVATAAKPDVGLIATEARIQVGGLLRQPNMGELAILDQVVQDALNMAYEGQETLRFESKEAFALDGDETKTMIMSEYVSQGLGGGYCPFCKLRPSFLSTLSLLFLVSHTLYHLFRLQATRTIWMTLNVTTTPTATVWKP